VSSRAQRHSVLENFKVGTLARYGLGPEDLKQVNPGLIYCSITGFGLDGPRSSQVAYDFMIQAMGGLMSVTGERDEAPGGGPQKVGVPIVDIMTGMYGTIAVLAALARRNETGEGELIDIGMLDVSVAMLANQAMNHLVSGATPTRKGNKHPNIQPQDVFAVKDGHIVLAVGNDDQFRRFARAIGRPELADDARFATNVERVRNLDVLHPMICDLFARDTMDNWLARLGAEAVPCGPINTIPRVFADEQVRHRGMVRTMVHPLTDALPQVVSPMRFSNAPLEFDRPPPLLGEHTAEVTAEFGARQEVGGPRKHEQASSGQSVERNRAGMGAGRASFRCPDRHEMSPEQQKVYDDVVNGPRGTLIGPLRAVIHSPELADRWQRFGEYVRYRTVIPKCSRNSRSWSARGAGTASSNGPFTARSRLRRDFPLRCWMTSRIAAPCIRRRCRGGHL
jgi:crotonobetainyl-CoA:carnitine CoA-transferase CaiB-like acyl-CoA transferase